MEEDDKEFKFSYPPYYMTPYQLLYNSIGKEREREMLYTSSNGNNATCPTEGVNSLRGVKRKEGNASLARQVFNKKEKYVCSMITYFFLHELVNNKQRKYAYYGTAKQQCILYRTKKSSRDA